MKRQIVNERLHPVLRYVLNILISIDQFVNTLLFGDPDETISSRLGKNYPDTWMAKTVDFFFFWDKNHTQKRIEWDEGKDAVWRRK